MKNLKLFATAILFTLTSNLFSAQKTIELENSTLWKIEHQNMEKPSYLLGTMHIMCEEDFKIPSKVHKVIDNVDALVLEVNISDPSEMKEIQESMLNAEKISDVLTKEKYHLLDKKITSVMGLPLKNFDAYGLSALNSFTLLKMLPCTSYKMYETELTQIVKSKNLPIYSLESAKEQMEIMKNAYPTEFAYQQLMLFDDYKKDFVKTIEYYKQENLSKTLNLVTQSKYMDENATKIMQIDRNKNWVEKMPEMMEARSNLFAVGAAHLTDHYGLIHLLRQKGYTVTAIIK